MRKLFYSILSAALVLTMAGCGASIEEQTEQIEQTVTSYFNDIQEGAYSDAAQFTDVDIVDELNYGKMTETIDQSIHALGLDAETETQLTESVHSTIGKAIDNYKIDNVTIEGDTAVVDLTVTGVDPDNLDELVSKLVKNYMSTIGEYLTSNYEQLFGALTGKGDKTMEDMVNDFNSELQTTFQETTRKTYKLKVELKLEGDQWKIASIKKVAEE